MPVGDARHTWLSTPAVTSPRPRGRGLFTRENARGYGDRARSLWRLLGVKSPVKKIAGELTAREREIAELVAAGLTDAEVARPGGR